MIFQQALSSWRTVLLICSRNVHCTWEGGGPNGQKEAILCLNFLVLPKNVNFIFLAAVTCNLAPDPGHLFPFLYPGVQYL